MLAAPMPEGGLLGPAADLVDHRVGQLDGVEVIDDHGGVAKRCHQRAGVAPPGVDRDRAHPGQPAVPSGTEPAGHCGPGAVGHQVQQPAALQVDQAGDPSGGRQAGGLEEAGLVQPKRGDPRQPRRVVHQRPAMIGHRPHHRRPADPQVACHCSDRMGVLADPPAGLGAGPFGQHRPRTDRGCPLGPSPHPASRLTTAPEALAPQQHHWPATTGQVAHPDHPSAVWSGSHPAARTAHHRRRRLDSKLPLAIHQLGRDDLQAVQVQQQRPRRTTLLTHWGLLADVRHPQAMRGLRSLLASYVTVGSTPPPRVMTKSPLL
jgi:hypothetical protein